jgi:hypothetical protein
MPRLFALTSWGNAGVPWIAKCLNLHPKIRTFVNARGTLCNLTHKSVTATEYLRHVADLSSEYYSVCGDVHGVSPHEFSELKETIGDHFRGAHLVAHPIPRFAGSLAISKQMGRYFSHDDFLKLWDLDRSRPLSKILLPILGENGDHVPAHYMMHVNGIISIVGSAPLFRLEELMAKNDEWASAIDYLSAGSITDYDGTWRRLKGVFIGVAHQPFGMGGPLIVWQSLSGLTRHVVSAMLNDRTRRTYECLGYDLSFIPVTQ